MLTMDTQRFSIAPLAELARAISTRDAPNFDQLLATLQKADRELDGETRALRRNLATTRRELVTANEAREKAEKERDDALSNAEQVNSLKELVTAREAAYNAQLVLVKQLQKDNAMLKASYEAARRRAEDAHAVRGLAQHIDDDSAFQDADERVVSVSVKGAAKNMRFSNAELVQVFQENERLQRAGSDLITTVAHQKDAHERLRCTVTQLMTQLEVGAKERDKRENEWKQKVQALEKDLLKLNEHQGNKDAQINKLQRQLNKVLAEYQAVSVAHSYSNAELSKLRVHTRAKKADRYDRSNQGGFATSVLGGVENLLHHRRNNNS